MEVPTGSFGKMWETNKTGRKKMSRWEGREMREGYFRHREEMIKDRQPSSQRIFDSGENLDSSLYNFKKLLIYYPGEMIIQFLLEHFQWEETDCLTRSKGLVLTFSVGIALYVGGLSDSISSLALSNRPSNIWSLTSSQGYKKMSCVLGPLTYKMLELEGTSDVIQSI